MFVDKVKPEESARLPLSGISEAGQQMPRYGHHQKNKKAGDQFQLEEMAQIARHRQVNKDSSDGEDQSNQALAEHIQRHGCGNAPAQPARRSFLLQSCQKKIKP